MKYVIFKDADKEIPIIFPELINHSRFVGLRPISAGFVNLYVKKLRNSLDLASKVWYSSFIKDHKG